MEAVRTPEHRFARLPGYPYPPVSIPLDEDGELRLAYVAEGAHENRPVMLLHGPPTWSYLWRRVIPMLVEGGCRAVVPDLIGFGRSDKPVRARDHKLDRHLGWLTALVEALDLRQAALVAHGAAAPLAFRLADAAGDRFARLVCVSPRFSGGAPADGVAGEAGELAASDLVALGCAAPLSETARRGYDAPFPEPEHRVGLGVQESFLAAGPDQLPAIGVPIAAVGGERDDPSWTSRLSGSPECRRVSIAGAGHYVPEERGPELALALLSLLAAAR